MLVVGAGEDVLSTEYRDQIRTGSTELANIYQEHEFKVTELSRPDREELANAVRHLQPQAIHIIANVFEQRDQLFLGFNAGPAMKGATDQLTPREIGSALLQSESPPLLILQIVAQAYPHELVRQLCLRNALAADLAAFERLPAILCTGLATGRTARRLNMRLVETLAASQSIGQVARAIWMEGAQVFAYESDREPQADSWLPLLGTALYTHDPEQIFR